MAVMNMNSEIKKEYKYSELTGKVIGCAMEVHSFLGNGFQEVIYQRSLGLEVENQNLVFSREYEMPIFYKDKQVGSRRVDFLVEHKICVELKAVTNLEKVHMAQAINYLEAYNLEIGLLLNFGNTRLEFHRLENNKYRPS